MNQSTLQNRLFAIEALTEKVWGEGGPALREIRQIAKEGYDALNAPLDDTIEIAVAVALDCLDAHINSPVSAVMRAFGGKINPKRVHKEIERQLGVLRGTQAPDGTQS